MSSFSYQLCSRVVVVMVMVIIVFVLQSTRTLAADFAFPPFSSYDDSVTIEAIDVPQLYYGLLNDFPHTYEFSVSGTTSVAVRLGVFADTDAQFDKNIIIVKKNRNGSVSEVKRLNAKDETWQDQYDWASNESYKAGDVYTVSFFPGDYFMEVNSPQNLGRYVLLINQPTTSIFSVFSEMSRTYQLKRFLKRPFGSFLFTPIYGVPLLAIILISLLFWLQKRKKRLVHDAQ